MKKLVIIVVVSLGGTCLGLAVNALQRDLDPDATIERGRTTLERISTQLGALRACSLRAEVVMEFHQAVEGGPVSIGVPIQGFYEFDALGNMWRTRSFMDPALYKGMDTEIAFNGEIFQYAARNADIVSISLLGGDDRVSGMTLPNPLVALGQFIIPDTGSVDNTTLSELRFACAQRPGLAASWGLEDTAQGVCAIANLAGATYMGIEYTTRVTVPARAGGPIVMEGIGPKGQTLLRMTFAEWVDVLEDTNVGNRTSSWPMDLTLEGFDPTTGAIAGTMRMKITEFATTGDTLDSSSFVLDWRQTDRVWLDEPGMFVR